jgi:glycerol-3-phosphate dehydrogenase subunit B
VRAEITSFERARGRVVAARSADRTFRADSFVLATGRHIGGGLLAGRTTTEPLLGLGVFYEGRPANTLGTRLHHLKYVDAAAQMRLGVMTDKRLHPLHEDGAAPYANVYAAGAMLGGYDYAGPWGFGVPILTGWLAGRYAAKQA